MSADMWDLWPSEFEESEIGEIPKGWKVGPVSSVVDINPERRLVRGEAAPYVEMGRLPTSAARVTGFVARAFASGSRFRNGDTLVARITPCLENGKTAFVDFLPDGQVGWGSTEFLVLSPKRPLPTQWPYLLARTEDFRTHLIQNMTGTSGRQRAPAECLDSFFVTVPSLEVAVRFSSVVAPWFESMKRSDDESITLASARDALLPKLLSGEIRVRQNDGGG
jgi:type I restriction enzyme S subunit